jgi:hypothetical protein
MEPAISSRPKACGVVFRYPRRRRVTRSGRRRKLRVPAKRSTASVRQGQPAQHLPCGKEALLPDDEISPNWPWWWVTFDEQSRVISRECRRYGRMGSRPHYLSALRGECSHRKPLAGCGKSLLACQVGVTDPVSRCFQVRLSDEFGCFRHRDAFFRSLLVLNCIS